MATTVFEKLTGKKASSGISMISQKRKQEEEEAERKKRETEEEEARKRRLQSDEGIDEIDRSTTAGVYGSIRNLFMNGHEKEGKEKLGVLGNAMSDNSSVYYNPYAVAPTSQTYKAMKESGMDMRGVNETGWYETQVRNGAISGISYSSDTGKTLKGDTEESKNAKSLETLNDDIMLTKEVKKEQAEVEAFVLSQIHDPRNTKTDEEIVNGINWDNYPNMKKLRESLTMEGRASAQYQLTDTVDVTDDYLYGVIQKGANADNESLSNAYGIDYRIAVGDYNIGYGNKREVDPNGQKKRHERFVEGDEGKLTINREYAPAYDYTNLDAGIVSRFGGYGSEEVGIEGGFPRDWDGWMAVKRDGSKEANELLACEENTRKTEDGYSALMENVGKISGKSSGMKKLQQYFVFDENGVIKDFAVDEDGVPLIMNGSEMKSILFTDESGSEDLKYLYGYMQELCMGTGGDNEKYTFTRAVPIDMNSFLGECRKIVVKTAGVLSEGGFVKQASKQWSDVAEMIPGNNKSDEKWNLFSSIKKFFSGNGNNVLKEDELDSETGAQENGVKFPNLVRKYDPKKKNEGAEESKPDASDTFVNARPESLKMAADADREKEQKEMRALAGSMGDSVNDNEGGEKTTFQNAPAYALKKASDADREARAKEMRRIRKAYAESSNLSSPDEWLGSENSMKLSGAIYDMAEYANANAGEEEMREYMLEGSDTYATSHGAEAVSAMVMYKSAEKRISDKKWYMEAYDANGLFRNSDGTVMGFTDAKEWGKSIGKLEMSDEEASVFEGEILPYFNAYYNQDYGAMTQMVSRKMIVPTEEDFRNALSEYEIDGIDVISSEMAKKAVERVEGGEDAVSVLESVMAEYGLDMLSYNVITEVANKAAEDGNILSDEAKALGRRVLSEEAEAVSKEMESAQKEMEPFLSYYGISGMDGSEGVCAELFNCVEMFADYPQRKFYAKDSYSYSVENGMDVATAAKAAKNDAEMYRDSIEVAYRYDDMLGKMEQTDDVKMLRKNIGYYIGNLQGEIAVCEGFVIRSTDGYKSFEPDGESLQTRLIGYGEDNTQFGWFEKAFGVDAESKSNPDWKYSLMRAAATDEEKKTYLYMLEKYGEDAADSYLSSIQDMLETRNTMGAMEGEAEFAKSGALEATATTAMNIVLSPTKSGAFIQNMVKTFQGKTVNPYETSNMISNLDSANAEAVTEAINKKFGEDSVSGFAARILFQSVKTAGESMLNAMLMGNIAGGYTGENALVKFGTGFLGASNMGLGAGNQAMISAQVRGASPEQAAAMGASSAFFETVTEAIPFNKMNEWMKGAIPKGGIGKILVESIASETVGEETTDIAQLVTDNLVMGYESERESKIRAWRSMGMTQEAAEARFRKDFAGQLVETALVSTIVATAGPSVKYAIGRGKVNAYTAMVASSANGNYTVRANTVRNATQSFMSGLDRSIYESAGNYVANFESPEAMTRMSTLMRQDEKAASSAVIFASTHKGSHTDIYLTSILKGEIGIDSMSLAELKVHMQEDASTGSESVASAAVNEIVENQLAGEMQGVDTSAAEQAQDDADAASEEAVKAENTASESAAAAEAADAAVEDAHARTEEDPSKENIRAEEGAVEEAIVSHETANEDAQKAENARIASEEANQNAEEAKESVSEAVSSIREKLMSKVKGVESILENVLVMTETCMGMIELDEGAEAQAIPGSEEMLGKAMDVLYREIAKLNDIADADETGVVKRLVGYWDSIINLELIGKLGVDIETVMHIRRKLAELSKRGVFENYQTDKANAKHDVAEYFGENGENLFADDFLSDDPQLLSLEAEASGMDMNEDGNEIREEISDYIRRKRAELFGDGEAENAAHETNRDEETGEETEAENASLENNQSEEPVEETEDDSELFYSDEEFNQFIRETYQQPRINDGKVHDHYFINRETGELASYTELLKRHTESGESEMDFLNGWYETGLEVEDTTLEKPDFGIILQEMRTRNAAEEASALDTQSTTMEQASENGGSYEVIARSEGVLKSGERIQNATTTIDTYVNGEQSRTQGKNPPKRKRVKSPQSIMKELSKKISIGLYNNFKHYNRGGREGYYAVGSGGAVTNRNQGAEFHVMAHELGHAVGELIGMMEGTDEMVGKLNPSFISLYAKDVQKAEAMAEFLPLYLTSRDAAVRYAGEQFVNDFEMACRRSGIYRSLVKARNEYNAYLDSDGLRQIAARTVTNEGKNKENAESLSFLEKFIGGFVDRTYRAGRLDRRFDVNIQEKLLRAQHVNNMVHEMLTGVLQDKDGNFIGEGLAKRLADSGFDFKGNFTVFLSYMEALHNWDRTHQYNPDTGAVEYVQNGALGHELNSEEELSRVIRDAEANYEGIRDAAEAFSDFWYEFMKAYWVDTGLGGERAEERLRNYRRRYPHYMAFQRSIGGAVTFEGSFERVHENDANIVNPMQTMIGFMNSIVSDVMRNEAGIQFYNAYGHNRNFLGEYATPIIKEDGSTVFTDADSRPTGDDVFEVFDKSGRRTFFSFSDRDFLSMMNLSQSIQGRNRAVDAVSEMNRFMTMLTTGSNALFALRNMMRDFQMSVNTGTWASNYVTGIVKWFAVANAYRRATNGRNNDTASMSNVQKLMHQYLGMGGGQMTRYNQGTDIGLDEMITEIFGSGTGESAAGKIRKAGKAAWDVVTLGRINEIVEQTSRSAEFVFGHHGGDQSLTGAVKFGTRSKAETAEAFQASQDVTVDFSRGGSNVWAQTFKSLIPFFNASLQGSTKTMRNLADALGRSGAKGARKAWKNIGKTVMNTAMMSAIAAAALIRCGADDDEVQTVAKGVAAGHFLFPIGNGEYARIPIGQDPLMYITNAVVMNSLIGKRSVAGSDYESTVVSLEALGDTVIDNLTGWSNNNGIFATIFQALSNKNYYGGSIVGKGTMYGLNETSYARNDDTYGFCVYLGSLMGLSGAQVQYILEQNSGWIGQFAIPLIAKGAEAGASEAAKGLFRDVKAKFTVDPAKTNDIVSSFYENRNLLSDMAKVEKNGWELTMLKPGLSEEETGNAIAEGAELYKEYKAAGETITELYKEIEAVNGDESLSDSEKMRITREIRMEIVNVAVECDESEDMEEYRQKYMRQENIAEYAVNRVVRGWLPNFKLQNVWTSPKTSEK